MKFSLKISARCEKLKKQRQVWDFRGTRDCLAATARIRIRQEGRELVAASLVEADKNQTPKSRPRWRPAEALPEPARSPRGAFSVISQLASPLIVWPIICWAAAH